MSKPIYLNHLAMLCALGNSTEEVRANLYPGLAPGMRVNERYSPGWPLPVGQVLAELPSLDAYAPALHSRNNQLALAALSQIRSQLDAVVARYGANRVAVTIGSSTSGIAEAEAAFVEHQSSGSFPPKFHYAQQELGAPAEFLRHAAGLQGPAYTVSTACSSSARALASAARLLNLGVVDAVLAGGVDTLCQFTIAGFSALESVSDTLCNPFSANRRGINIGEGAALFVVSRDPGPVRLLGWGESADGYHMSAPHPEGLGATLAMQAALRRAALPPAAIDYINLHGTATRQNDAMESRAVAGMFGCDVSASSTKPLTGHTLGAAGAIEAAICWLTLQQPEGNLPPQLWDGVADPELPHLHLAAVGERLGRRVRTALSNSFAFGGNNAALILGGE